MLQFLFLGLILSLCQAGSAAESRPGSANDPFDVVPAANREEVKSSVDRIVKLYKERQWDKIYDLLDRPSTPREEYVQERSHTWTLLEFFPTEVHQRRDSNTDWAVDGCALVDEHGKKERWESFILIGLKARSKPIRLLISLKKRGGPMTCVEPTAKAQ